jgi:hypothetical protein
MNDRAVAGGTCVAEAAGMTKRKITELRRLLATATTSASAHDVWNRLIDAVNLDAVILRGEAEPNDIIDRLLSRVATQVFGQMTVVRDSTYFVRWGLWHDVVDIRGVRAWTLYEEVSGRGIVGFALPGVDPATWFHPLSRADLVSERSAVA